MKVTNNISEIALFCIAVHYLAGALPLPFQKGERVVEVPFHNSFIGNIMFDQGRLETNLLQLFTHPENSEWFSIISGNIFRLPLLMSRNKRNW